MQGRTGVSIYMIFINSATSPIILWNNLRYSAKGDNKIERTGPAPSEYET